MLYTLPKCIQGQILDYSVRWSALQTSASLLERLRLEGMPIEALSLDRSFPRLKEVNSEPAADFWKKVSETK
jgi:hypothetical protein